MNDISQTIDRSRRHHQAETHRQTVHLPGQTIGHPGGGAIIWAIITQMPEYNDATKAKYIIQKANFNGTAWVGDETDIEITRALGYEGHGSDALDIRNWFPWYPVDSLVKIISKIDQTTGLAMWYIDMPMMYGGPEDESSLRFDETKLIPQAVWV